jgi:LysR family transcriptional activator of nhaA
MADLNYHHLRYFHAIAEARSLTRAAERLHVSQSALSIQLRQLEERLGHALFTRVGRRLELTEAGRIALDHAQVIFRTGDELVTTLRGGAASSRRMVRIGAVATLSRNFQREFVRPLLGREDVEIVLRSASLRELLAQLAAHTIDVVLSNTPVQPDAAVGWHSHLLAQQPVSLVGRPPKRGTKRFRFPEDVRGVPLALPTHQSDIRAGFDRLLDAAGIRPVIYAEADDMAILRLLAREGPGLALVPPVVVQGELREGVLVERCRVPELRERFYAITPSRRFPNALARELVKRGSVA